MTLRSLFAIVTSMGVALACEMPTTAGESAGRTAAELAEAAGSTGRCECTVGMNASTTATPRPAATTRRMEMELM